MQSVANSGLKPRLLEYYKREVMQVSNALSCTMFHGSTTGLCYSIAGVEFDFVHVIAWCVNHYMYVYTCMYMYPDGEWERQPLILQLKQSSESIFAMNKCSLCSVFRT